MRRTPSTPPATPATPPARRPRPETVAHALRIVVATHRARCNQPTRDTAAALARAEGATPTELRAAIARGTPRVTT